MKEKDGQHEPCARKEGLVVRELPDEVLVYDLERDRAHCLNTMAAKIWTRCDGRTSVASIAKDISRELKSPIDENVVWYALDQLGSDNLLQEKVSLPSAMAGMSRRQMVRTLGLAALVSVPLVTTITAPTPAQAVTCLPSGSACSSAAQCCSNLCPGAPSGTCS